MVYYSQKQQKALVCGIEAILGFLFRKGENFVIRNFNKKLIYGEIVSSNDGNVSRKQVADLFSELKRHKYIEYIESSENSIKLTNKAKIKIVERIIEELPADERLRFISFDIPERFRHRRNLFRRSIKKMGFKQLQQSLWVCNKNVGEMVEILAEDLKINDYIVYIISDNTNSQEHIRKILGC